jgi:2'-5' RNA ligase
VTGEQIESRRHRGRYVLDDRPGRRLFVAVPIPDVARVAVETLVAGVRADAKPGVRDVRWVRMDGLHVTLRFLGPTPEDKVAGVVEAVDAAAAGARPFAVMLRGAGAFPSAARPRALWLGVDDGADELAALAAGLDDALVDLGWPRSERPFRAHLTLARADGVRAGRRVADRLTSAAATFGASFEAGSVGLFETRSGEGPARYENLHMVPFGPPEATRNRE